MGNYAVFDVLESVILSEAKNLSGRNIDSSVLFASLRVPQNDVTGVASFPEDDMMLGSGNPVKIPVNREIPRYLRVFEGFCAKFLVPGSWLDADKGMIREGGFMGLYPP